jgi:hypothetical protein
VIALSDAIADALLTTRWHTQWPNAAHGQHHYDASCAICAGDIDAIAIATVAAKAAATQVRAEAAMELREDAEAHRRKAMPLGVRGVVLRLRAQTIDMAAARITQGDQ